MNESVRLSVARIKTMGSDNPMLHNDALKVVAALEHLEAVQSGDITNDTGYLEFVEGQRKYCKCSSRYAPCDGVLAGGMCDDMQDDEEDRCLFCNTTNCYGDCIESEMY